MNYNDIAKSFLQKKYQLNMGAGKLSKLYKCTKDDIYKAKELARKEMVNSNLPKILILDVETAPLKAYVWQRYKQNIYPDQMLSEWFILTWSAKWLFAKEIMSDKITKEEVLKEDDKRIVTSLWKLLDEADIVIAHNGDLFDVPMMNGRFVIHGIVPPSPYKTIDTKKVAAKKFKFSSNKLSELAKYFGFKGKLDTDFELWAKCMSGDEVAITYMQKYNDQDIIVLEEVYLKLRPWIDEHPNIGLYMELDKPVCGHCGSDKLTYLDKFHYTQTGKFETYRCECGAIGRRRINSFDKDKKEELLLPL